MLDSADKEWRRLSEHYAGMYDEELMGLARDYADLTEMAQQVLRDEMKKRSLGDPAAPRMQATQRVSEPPSQGLSRPPIKARAIDGAQAMPPDPRAEQDRMRFAERYAGQSDDDLLDLADDMDSLTQGAQLALAQELERRGLGEVRAISDSQEDDEEDALSRAEQRMAAPRGVFAGESEAGQPHDYTWKVELGEFNTREEAAQRMEMLRRAGVESWFVNPAAYFADPYAQPSSYRISVAADQLEDAQQIVSHPVPPDIVEQSQVKAPDYEMPRCPRCHTADPVLIDTEPTNKWLCESCGNEWAETVPEDAEK